MLRFHRWMIVGGVALAQSLVAQTAPVGSVPTQEATAEPASKTYTVPAGTKILLGLRSAVDSRTAKEGDGVYLATTFPVVVNNQVLIPAGVFVQGRVDQVVRPGKVKGRAQILMHFTSMIFPNGSVVAIPGNLNSAPGSGATADGKEGTLTQGSNNTKDLGRTAQLTMAGSGLGAVVGGVSGSSAISGAAIGAGGGLAAGAVASMFTRGEDISLPLNAPVEMVLQRQLLVQDVNLAPATTGIGAANQPQPMAKPNANPSPAQVP